MKLKLKYVINKSGKKTDVQIPIKEWKYLYHEHLRLLDFKKMKVDLSEATKEILLTENGKRSPRTLKQFLNGL